MSRATAGQTTIRAGPKLRVRVNRSQGLTEDIIQITGLLAPGDVYTEYYPAAFVMTVLNVSTGVAIALLDVLGEARSAGTWGKLRTRRGPATPSCSETVREAAWARLAFKTAWPEGSPSVLHHSETYNGTSPIHPVGSWHERELPGDARAAVEQHAHSGRALVFLLYARPQQRAERAGDEHAGGYAGAAEQASLTAFGHRANQVDNLDAGFQHLDRTGLVHERPGVLWIGDFW